MVVHSQFRAPSIIWPNGPAISNTLESSGLTSYSQMDANDNEPLIITQIYDDTEDFSSHNNGAFSSGYISFFGSSNSLSSEFRFDGAHGSAGFNAPLFVERDRKFGQGQEVPTDPAEMRKTIRRKMHRCKVCKNRFVEQDIYERHLKDVHPDRYEKYMEEQAKIMEEQRLSELEQMRREEIKSGGFILPAREVEEAAMLTNPEEIRLPDDDDRVKFYIRDEFGLPVSKSKTKRKKISPQCPFCDKRFRNENSLKKHVAKKHPECISFVQCNKCFKCVPSRDHLKDHACELIHMCWECTPVRNMITEERLEVHRIKFHRGAFSGFKCPDCPRKFLTPRKLRKHRKMTHIVRKPYKCHFCDEYFPTDTQAALHERIHTGKIKFECNICDFRTNRFVRLHEHKRKEHGYICVICNEKTVEYAELKYHTLEKHGGYLSSESQAVFIESPRVWILYKGE